MEKQAERDAIQRQKEDEEALRKQVNLEVKEKQKSALDMQRRNVEDKVRKEADQVKHEKQQQKDFMHVMRYQETLKNNSLKQMIRSQQSEAKEKKQRELMEKQLRAKQQIEDKMMKEESKRIEHQHMIERMEREELELTQRL